MCRPPWNTARPALADGVRRVANGGVPGTAAADLGGGDAVDKADLLESLLAHGETNFPPVVDRLIHHLERHTGLVQFVLYVQVHVAAEPVDLAGVKEEKQVINQTLITSVGH